MTPPEMRTWNLALRFRLELAALTGLGLAAWSQTTGAARAVLTIATPLAAATMWATFNVLADPSRSGRAPVEISGRVRLGLELLIFGSSWIGYGAAGHPVIGTGLALVTGLHYLASRDRVRWLLTTTPRSSLGNARESEQR